MELSVRCLTRVSYCFQLAASMFVCACGRHGARAAMAGCGCSRAVAQLFKRYDKSGDGSLDVKELQRALRRDLKITPEELSDADIDALVEALDDDGSMSLSIDELADFVERGTATFFSGPSDDAAPAPAPDESQALAFPGGMNDPNLPLVLRLRDDAIVSKDRQIAVISGQNDQLRGSLEQMEAEIASMLETLVGKDRELQKQQRTLDKRERELSRLRVVQSQSEGKDQAMEVSSKQNASLLQLLEETEEKARELGLENGALKDELKRQTFFAEKRVTKATNAHERIKADLAGEKLRAGVLEEQRAALSSSLAASTTRGARIELEVRSFVVMTCLSRKDLVSLHDEARGALVMTCRIIRISSLDHSAQRPQRVPASGCCSRRAPSSRPSTRSSSTGATALMTSCSSCRLRPTGCAAPRTSARRRARRRRRHASAPPSSTRGSRPRLPRSVQHSARGVSRDNGEPTTAWRRRRVDAFLCRLKSSSVDATTSRCFCVGFSHLPSMCRLRCAESEPGGRVCGSFDVAPSRLARSYSLGHHSER